MTFTEYEYEQGDVYNPGERAVLGGLLLSDGDLPASVYQLEPEYFEIKEHAIIFTAMQCLTEGKQPIDTITVKTWLDENEYYRFALLLAELEASTPTVVNLEHWITQVCTDGIERLNKQRLSDCISQIDLDDSSESIANAMETAIKRTAKKKSNDGVSSFKEALHEMTDNLQNEYQNPELAVSVKTGLREVDKLLKLRPKQMTILAARPGVGKTTLAGTIALATSRNGHVGATVFFSQEMSTDAVSRRLIAGQASVTSEALKYLSTTTELAPVLDDHMNLDLHICDKSSVDISTMKHVLAGFSKVKLVVIDYLQLMRMDDSADRHDLKVGATTKSLKEISKDFDCHVLVLSQLNRKVESRDDAIPKLSDLRDSGAIEEDADNVVFIFRPAMHFKEQDEKLAHIIIAKQRAGATTSHDRPIEVGFDAALTKFYDKEGR